MPKISVTMAVCNVERYLSEAIESVLRQTFTDFEFIIVDFGSVDNSKSIVGAHALTDSRIKFFETHSRNLATARNEAWSIARGEFVAIMDADDICLPNRLQHELEFMESHPGVGLMGGAVEWINAAGQSLGFNANPAPEAEIRSALLVKCPFWHPTVFIRRAVLAQIGGYRESFVLAHDYDMELRVADHCGVANTGEIVLKYRIHSNQLSLRRQREQSLCKLAAQESASRRKAGQSDPLDHGMTISPAALLGLGVSEATQGRHFFSDFHSWIGHMSSAGEDTVVISAVREIMQPAVAMYAQDWQLADLWLIVAKARWGLGEYFQSIAAYIRAIALSPRVLGRPMKRYLRRATRGQFRN